MSRSFWWFLTSPPPVTNCHTFSDPLWSVTYFMDGPNGSSCFVIVMRGKKPGRKIHMSNSSDMHEIRKADRIPTHNVRIPRESHKIPKAAYVAISLGWLTLVIFEFYARELVTNRHLVTIRQMFVYPWECWNRFLVTRWPPWCQPARVREETLESGQL